MRRLAAISLVGAILCVPGALLVGNHNGLTVTGCILAVVAIGATIAHTPRRN
ncbi:hypothetical protein [Microbacterium arborescens]